MQDIQKIFNHLLNGIRVALSDEFNENFQRRAFFDRPWKPNRRGTTTLNSTGALFKSIQAKVQNNEITWHSSLPYAYIHNNGGEIIVTDKMKKYFWYKFRMATGGNYKDVSPQALSWKYMAMMKPGTKIKIEQRQFIGTHPKVHELVKKQTDEWAKTHLQSAVNNLFKKL